MSSMEMVPVRFEPEGVEVDVETGWTVHEAAAAAGVLLDAPCGGFSRCGACRVRATGGLEAPRAWEKESLSPADLAAGVRLACMARIEGPATIERLSTIAHIRVDAGYDPSMVAAAPGRFGLGVAVDVGTTTLAASLYDLADGRRIATKVSDNPQIAFGHDVMTRISRSLEGDAEALRSGVVTGVSGLVHDLLDAAGGASLKDMVIVGNPAMIHLLLGLDVSPLATAPYEGGSIGSVRSTLGDLGLPGPAGVPVFVAPEVSAFVGADAVAGMIATGLAARRYPTLLIDLGTNGELVLQADDWMLATSAAAGPALEGVSISSGMRAEPGAIERVLYADGTLRVGTVGGGEARGVCGSGLLDAIAAMLDAGVLRADGRLVAEGPLADRVSSAGDGVRFELAEGVHLTQQDVRQVQLAKGAVAVAVGVLLDEAGISADDVREVLVGGGFGSRVSPASLVRLGVLPGKWGDRVTFVGNTALAGAAAMLLDPGARARAALEASAVRTIPLATRPDFESRFLSSLDFPMQVRG